MFNVSIVTKTTFLVAASQRSNQKETTEEKSFTDHMIDRFAQYDREVIEEIDQVHAKTLQNQVSMPFVEQQVFQHAVQQTPQFASEKKAQTTQVTIPAFKATQSTPAAAAHTEEEEGKENFFQAFINSYNEKLSQENLSALINYKRLGSA